MRVERKEGLCLLPVGIVMNEAPPTLLFLCIKPRNGSWALYEKSEWVLRGRCVCVRQPWVDTVVYHHTAVYFHSWDLWIFTGNKTC